MSELIAQERQLGGDLLGAALDPRHRASASDDPRIDIKPFVIGLEAQSAPGSVASLGESRGLNRRDAAV
jgi:hypothetical protein